MAKKMRFKKPNLSVVWGEIIALSVWLVFGEKVVDVLDNLVGEVNDSVFVDAFEFLGLGTTDGVDNASNGLLGIVALILTVAILMNFISYN